MHRNKKIPLFLVNKRRFMANATVFSAQILILIYLIITFTYSAFEKLLQWKESVLFYTDHFKETFLKNSMTFLLKLVILIEIITVVICLIGLVNLLFFQEKQYAFYGLILVGLTLIGLMFGQRVAKDYAGAMNITVYFILTVIFNCRNSLYTKHLSIIPYISAQSRGKSSLFLS